MTDFKPGDVALVRYSDTDSWVVGIATTPHGNWRTEEHGTTYVIAEARPLLTVDLEDHDALDPIIDLIWGDRNRANRPPTWRVREGLKALISAPPKPDEPTGWLARVEDSSGTEWVRWWERGHSPWSRVKVTGVNGRHVADPSPGKNCGYDQIAAVRVLSEGITP